jgi:hypothetical protein
MGRELSAINYAPGLRKMMDEQSDGMSQKQRGGKLVREIGLASNPSLDLALLS